MKHKGLLLMTATVLGTLAGAAAGAYLTERRMGEEMTAVKSLADKHLISFRMCVRWMELRQQGKHVADFLKRKGYRSTAIYGMGALGEQLYKEIRDQIPVLYGIDAAYKAIYSELEIVPPDGSLSDVDVIIVTPAVSYREICKKLEEKTNAAVYPLADILYSM